MLSIIAISQKGEGYELADKLAREGHLVKMFIRDTDYRTAKAKENKNPKLIENLDIHMESGDIFLFLSRGFGSLAENLGNSGRMVFGGGLFQDIMVKEDFKNRLFTLFPKTLVEGKGYFITLSGWFNGQEWLKPLSYSNITTRLMDNDKGPLTNGMGIVTEFCEGRIFEETLFFLTKILTRESFVGALNFDIFINEKGFIPLDMNADFRLPIITFLECLKGTFGEFLFSIKEKQDILLKSNISMACLLSYPPYPYIMLANSNGAITLDPEVKKHFHQTLPGGSMLGYISARGVDMTEAKRRVYRTINNIVKDDEVQYRDDIGKRFEEIKANMKKWRWINAIA